MAADCVAEVLSESLLAGHEQHEAIARLIDLIADVFLHAGRAGCATLAVVGLVARHLGARALALDGTARYADGMKTNTKSSITLPAAEVRLVRSLKAKLKVRTNVEVVRRGLRLLQATTDRAELQEAYRRASKAVRAATRKEIAELDHLSGEGLG